MVRDQLFTIVLALFCISAYGEVDINAQKGRLSDKAKEFITPVSSILIPILLFQFTTWDEIELSNLMLDEKCSI